MEMHKQQEVLANRIRNLCREKGFSYYMLSYKSTVPLTTIMHILDGTTSNPGMLTIMKLCEALNISLVEFFDTEDFSELFMK